MRFKDIDEALASLPRHLTVVLQTDCAEPQSLVESLLARASQFEQITLFTMTQMNATPYGNPHAFPNVQVICLVPGHGLLRMVAAGRCQVERCPVSAVPSMFASGEFRADALFLQLSVPDERGYASLGLSVDFMDAVIASGVKIFAEINPNVPRTCGEFQFSLDRAAYVVESNVEPYTIEPQVAASTDERIADHLAGLMSNGVILQTGVGAVADLFLRRLADFRDIGLHTGLLTDGARHLIEKGVVTNAYHPLFKGRAVATRAAGTRAFYDFLHDNPCVELLSCSKTHDKALLSTIPRFTAVNSVLEVDLLGRANAEMLEGRLISAPGGLPDFASGASLAPGGGSIIVLRSTSRDGAISRIKRSLDNSATTLASDAIDTIVTEFGVAHIRGLHGSDRGRAIVEIADPAFRSDLLRQI
jgi:4-hydroxybutyrate CoA-transferase